ncbi:hypothetical protein JW916_07445 [Candidatus Sumerlaeota bacterium]|nr:hypothetical protein [Candidatus Sumerlaeota bacterium]
MPIQPNQMSVRELLEMVFQHKWVFLVCALLGLTIAFVAARNMDKWYDSKADIQVEDRMSNDPALRNLVVTPSVQQRFATVHVRIKSVESMKRLGIEAGLIRSDDMQPEKAETLRGKIQALQTSIRIGLNARSGIISVRCERRDPKEAYDICRRIVNALKEENTRIRESDIRTTRELLEKLRDRYSIKMRDAQTVLRDFREINMLDLEAAPPEMLRETNALVSESGGPKAQVLRLVQLLSRQSDNEIRMESLKAKRDNLRERIQKEPPFRTSEVTLAPSEMKRLLDEKLAKARSDLTDLMVDKTTSHPLVQERIAEIGHYEEQLSGAGEPIRVNEKQAINPNLEQMNLQLAEIETDIAAIETEQTGLGTEIEDMVQRVHEIPSKELEKLELEQEFRIQSATYQDIRRRLEQTELTNTLESEERDVRFIVLNEASYSEVPIRPNEKFIWVMGVFVGAVLGVALSFLLEFLDTSFRNLDDASRYLDLPVLGVIPEVEGRSRRRSLSRRRQVET